MATTRNNDRIRYRYGICLNDNCEKCKFRARYDRKPDSFLGKFWRWHINFCQGWKGYFTSLSEEQKKELRKKYNFTKYQ